MSDPNGVRFVAVQALLSGKLPPKGTVLSPDIALCEECKRKDSKPADLALTEFKRPHQVQIDPEKCLLAQGLVCMGPATRGGCGSLWTCWYMSEAGSSATNGGLPQSSS